LEAVLDQQVFIYENEANQLLLLKLLWLTQSFYSLN